MNIVHVCLANYFSDEYGYQENLLTKYHKKMGFNVTVLTTQWTLDQNGNLIKVKKNDYMNENGVRILRLPSSIGGVANRFKWFKNICNILDEINPDIIFIHCPQFLNILTIGKYLENHSNVIAYVDNHSDYSNSATTWISKNIQHRVVWHYCISRVKRYISKFFGVLPARIDFMKDLYGLQDFQCKLLVMGADDELIEKAATSDNIRTVREKHGIRDDDFLIVTGGKIDLYKIQTILLMEAVRRINSERVKLLIFGSVDKAIQPEVDKLVDGKKIQNISWIATDKSYDYFAAADLIVFPGRHSVFWEQAVAQGKPLVVKDWQGTHHIDIGGNVIYLYKDSADEIEAVIRSLVEADGTGKKVTQRYEELKLHAESERRSRFYYSSIAKQSLEME